MIPISYYLILRTIIFTLSIAGIFLNSKNSFTKCIVLSTAHASKFSNDVEKIINQKIELPDQIKNLLHKDKISIKLNNKFASFKEFLLAN